MIPLQSTPINLNYCILSNTMHNVNDNDNYGACALEQPYRSA